MKVCVTCRCEMTCEKTGATLHYGNGHCYSCDIHRCPTCGARVAVSNPSSYHLNPTQVQQARLRMGEYFIEMSVGA